MTVYWIDYTDTDEESLQVFSAGPVPRVGEKVGSVPLIPESDVYRLDTVVEVRHYTEAPSEVRVLVKASSD